MRLYVPYPFSFSSSPGNALIQSNLAEGSAWPYPVQVTVEFERLANCVHVSHEGVVVCRRDNGERLSDDDLAAHLLVTYVHLHGDEKIRFRQRRRIEQLMVVADPWYFWPGAGQSTLSLPLGDYGSPIVEIIFVVRRGCNLQRGRRFDYSGVDGRDPILYAQVRYGNDLVRFPWRDGVYYHRVVPREVHSRVPRDYIHVASYALDPQCTQPSGMSAPRIQNLFLDVELQEGLGPNTEIIVFVRYYQRLYYEDHRAFVERALCI